MNPTVGCRFGLGDRLRVNVSFGYTFQKAKLEYFHSENVTIGGLNIKVGLDF